VRAEVKSPARTHTGADEEPLPFTRAQRQATGITDDVWKHLRLDCRFFADRVIRVHGDRWQEKFWGALSGPHIDPTAKRMLALKACKGPGKTFGLGVGGWWWLGTRWHANGVAMSITADNLKDCLWKEMATLQSRSDLLSQFFAHRGERIECKEYAKDWWLSARSFPQNADKSQQANTLAGIHGRHPIVLGDEAGDYPDGVVVAMEAVLSSLVDGKPPDGRIMLAGNATSTEGPLYRITMRDRARWWVHEISSRPGDPDRSTRVDEKWAQEQIDSWGIDSDFVKINILGQFPSQQANKLIGPDLVLEASLRKLDGQYLQQPLVFGLDVAGYGDNASVLFQRQGLMTWRPRVWREVNHMVLADQVAQEYANKNPAAVFVDNSPVSVGLIDRLVSFGVPVIRVDFGGSPIETRFADRRSEMYFKVAQWLKSGGCIPDDTTLRHELVAPSFAMRAVGRQTRMKLESKDEMKKRGVVSPDMADALALTFAAPVFGGPPVGRDLEHFGRQEEAGFSQVMGPGFGRFRGGTEENWDPFGGD